MSIREKISQNLKSGMQGRDTVRVSTCRLILAAVKDREIARRGNTEDPTLPDADILVLLKSMVKQRLESIKLYEQGGRLELVEQEQREINVIAEFLPQQLSEAEVQAAINLVFEEITPRGLKSMGAVMALLKERHPTTLDFQLAGKMVKQRLISE